MLAIHGDYGFKISETQLLGPVASITEWHRFDLGGRRGGLPKSFPSDLDDTKRSRRQASCKHHMSAYELPCLALCTFVEA